MTVGLKVICNWYMNGSSLQMIKRYIVGFLCYGVLFYSRGNGWEYYEIAIHVRLRSIFIMISDFHTIIYQLCFTD